MVGRVASDMTCGPAQAPGQGTRDPDVLQGERRRPGERRAAGARVTRPRAHPRKVGPGACHRYPCGHSHRDGRSSESVGLPGSSGKPQLRNGMVGPNKFLKIKFGPSGTSSYSISIFAVPGKEEKKDKRRLWDRPAPRAGSNSPGCVLGT